MTSSSVTPLASSSFLAIAASGQGGLLVHVAQGDLAGLFHGGADHIESFLGHLAVGCQEVGVVPTDPVDLGLRNEALDVDSPGALQPDGLDLLVRQDDVFALGDFVALHEFRSFDRPRIRIRGDHLDAVVGSRIDQVKVDIAARVRRDVERDWAGNEGEFEVTLPAGTVGHVEILRAGP